MKLKEKMRRERLLLTQPPQPQGPFRSRDSQGPVKTGEVVGRAVEW